MSNFEPIQHSIHATKRWKRYNSYQFSALDAVVPLVVQELARACMSMPVAFVQQGDTFVPVAVQGLRQGQNLFVSTDGRWIGSYTPAAYRGYPFALANANDGQVVLCVDTASGLVDPSYDEPFFDDSGEPSQSVKDVLNFLQQIRANRSLTERLCMVLHKEELIQPWPITIKGNDNEQTLQGLYRIDESKVNALSEDALKRIHQEGALPIIYCQLLSMQHLQTLGKLAQMHAKISAQQDALETKDGEELDLEFLNKGGTISFGPH
jgi:hypothetical protein